MHGFKRYIKQLSLGQRLAIVGISALIFGLNYVIEVQQSQNRSEQSHVER